MPNSLFDSGPDHQPWDLHTLITNYNKGLQGAINDLHHRDQFLSSIPSPLFADAGKALSGSGKGKLSLPFKSVLFFDKDSFSERQQTGDCVSFGTRNAVDVSRAVQIHIGHSAEGWIVRGATEAIYGSRGHGGQGMSGSTAAQFVHSKGGILLRKKYPSADLTKYTVNYGIRWGTAGIPSDIIQAGKEHQVTTLALIRTLDEARDALANGYGLACCSNQGFSSVRDNKGFARPQGSWSHCYQGHIWISGPKFKEIKDVEIDDIVYGHDGKGHRVTYKFEREYNGDLIKIRAVGMPIFQCTDEHPIYVAREEVEIRDSEKISTRNGIAYVATIKRKFKKLKFEWVPANEIKIGDYLVSPTIEFNEQNEIEIPELEIPCKQVKNKPIQFTEPDDDLAWLFGLYIADGNIVANHKVVITLGSKEIHSIERAIIAFRKLGMKTHVYDKGTFVRITVYSSVLARQFIKWFNGSSKTKRIPQFLFKGWNLKEVISGIFDGDGCYHREGNLITTTSRELAYQIFHILVSSGNSANISYKTKFSNGAFPNASPQWRIFWYNNKITKGTKFDGMNYLIKVREINKIPYNGKVYNLEVDKVNSYIADGISVHNCMAWTACDDTGSEPAFMIQIPGRNSKQEDNLIGDQCQLVHLWLMRMYVKE